MISYLALSPLNEAWAQVTGEVAEYVEVECDGSWDDAADELIRRLHDAGVENGQA